MKRLWIEVFVNILFWISTAWLITTSFSIQSQEIEFINDVETIRVVRNSGLINQILLCISVSFIAFYLNAWLTFNLNKSKTNIKSVWVSAFILLISLTLIFLLSEIVFASNGLPIPKQIAFGIPIFYFTLSIAYSLAKLWVHSSQRQQQLMIDKKQAELNLLRNQLQPHFLFNALNNLLSMVDPSENPKLVDSFERLSQLLRYVIEGTHEEKVSIEKEIAFLKNYIELQMLRFSEGEVSVEFKVNGAFSSQKVEPGLFIAFVENAFKYGTEPENRAKIDIEFELTNPESIQFKIRNKVLMKSINGIGTGIDATRKRLEMIYPDSHKLDVSKDEFFTVNLTINKL